MSNRRSFISQAFRFGAGIFAAPRMLGASTTSTPASTAASKAASTARLARTVQVPVQTPDGRDLLFTLDNGVKVFHLIAEPVKQKIHPAKTLDLWGFNGSAPGPTIQVNQGDRVRVILDNHLPEPTSMHWHGFEDTIANDGMPGISQPVVRPGGRFVYNFNIHQAGTYFYHSHMAMQEMAGMLGAFIMHPAEAYTPQVDQDFVILLQEYGVLPASTIPNTTNMEYNWLVFNGKAGPDTTPLVVRLGQRVRIRLINLGMDHHPVHLHGHTFHTTGTEGGRIPPTAWWPGNTVLVGVAQARDIEFTANNPGDWMVHCHLPHHMMNQMSTNVSPLMRSGLGDQPTSNGPLTQKDMEQAMPEMAGMHPGKPADHAMAGMEMDNAMAGMHMDHAMAEERQDTGSGPEIAANANSVPNFPQDAFMESPAMNMDTAVDRAANYGLRPGWSAYMQGMMTFLRVLPADQYDEVRSRMRKAGMQGTGEV